MQEKVVWKVFLLLIVFLSCAVSGLEAANPKARIIVDVSYLLDDAFEIFKTDMFSLDLVSLGKSDVRMGGGAKLEFQLPTTSFLYISVGDRRFPVLLSPGSELSIHIESQTGFSGILFKGDFSKENQYLLVQWINKIQFGTFRSEHVLQLPPVGFISVMDSMKLVNENLLAKLGEETGLSEQTKHLLSYKNEMDLINLKQRYYGNHVKSRQGESNSFKMMEGSISTIPFDSVAFNSNMAEYAAVLNSYFRQIILAPFNRLPKDGDFDSLRREIPVLATNKIYGALYPHLFSDFFLVKNLHHWMWNDGITKNIDSLYKATRQKDISPEFLRVLTAFYKDLQNNAPGADAPEIAGTTPDGSMLDLKGLKGKVVYVDIWATWCGPCREEFPNSVKLTQHFKNEKDVVFLFVSLDRNVSAWRQMLHDSRTPAGVHINQSDENTIGMIYKAYHISGIPRYILIGKDGKILEADARRPSSTILLGQIKNSLVVN